MKSSFAVLLLSGQAASTAIGSRYVSRQSSQGCCFQLDSAGTVSEDVEEDHTGKLHLAGDFQTGSFCLNDGKIQDGQGNQCFIRAPKYQFQCYQSGVIGNTSFAVVPATDNSPSKLIYDDGVGTYLACSADGKTYEIYSTSKPETTGCLEVSLVLSETNGECPVSTAAATSSYSVSKESCAKSVIRRNPKIVSEDAKPPEPSSTCSVSPTAPSLTPIRIGFPDMESLDGIHDTDFDASITSTNSTVFQFSIPRAFVVSESKKCALEFRFPVCGTLPADYPCFSFTGSEQEMLSNSGMAFSQFGNATQLSNWDNTALQQVYPGDNKILGVFECWSPTHHNCSQRVAWMANSVRNFGLLFEQAGVGSSKFSDGVGVFVVQCS